MGSSFDFRRLLNILVDQVKAIDRSRLESAPDIDAWHFDLVQSSPFTNPIHIFATATDAKYPSYPKLVTPFFNLPNLHSFYVWKFKDTNEQELEDNSPFPKLKPRSCPVEYIELRTSKLKKANLQFLLDATIPGKLKTFNYEIGALWPICHVNHLAIMRALAAHHGTLQNLGLSLGDDYPYDNTDGVEV